MKSDCGKSTCITFFNNRREIYPPLGICCLSAALKEKGYGNISLIDRLYENNKEIVRAILRTKPDIIGMSTYSTGIYDIMEVSKQLKQKAPGVPIVWGGPHITSLPKTLPDCVDIGVIGEAEETLIEIVENITSCGTDPKYLKQIRGISFHDGEKVYLTEERPFISELDSLPAPDYSLLDMSWYLAPKRYLVMRGIYRGITIISSRGCPFRCIYCQSSNQWKRIRYYSPEYVVNTILNLKHSYPYINAVNIVDDLFTANRERLIKIVKLIKDAGLCKGISYNVNSRPDIVDKELLALLKEINVIQIGYGFESGSQKILSYLKNNTVSIEDNENAAEMTNKYGIGVGGQFMIGTPGETKQDMLKTADFLKRHAMSHAHLSVTTPLPGTQLWEYAKEKGFVDENMDWRRLDFGNPNNPRLVYINDALEKNEFEKMKTMIQNLCDFHNKNNTLYEKFQILLGKRFAWRYLIKAIQYRIRGYR